MEWKLEEALQDWRHQGAPSDQNALVSLLKEIQQNSPAGLTEDALRQVAEGYGLRESFLLAIVKRFPSLRLTGTHCLELCGGPNCTRSARLADFVRRTYGEKPEAFLVKQTPCMHQCAKGPNIRWDGVLYNGADEALIRSLAEKKN